jgi:hypothetical protein
MNSIDGSWQVVIDSPMGKQPLFVDLKADSDKLVGTARANGQTIDPDIFDGQITGDVVSWKVKVRKPVPLTMTLTLTHSGDKLVGKCKPGMFGTFPATGTRLD